MRFRCRESKSIATLLMNNRGKIGISMLEVCDYLSVHVAPGQLDLSEHHLSRDGCDLRAADV